MTLFLGRDTKVYLAKGSNIWEVPVMNGYALNQGTNTSTVTLSEMSSLTGASRRGQKQFNDAVAPAEWSFDVYVRPYINTGLHRAVDEVLWANFAATNPVFTEGATPDLDTWSQAITYSATQMDVDFDDSNYIQLGTFDIYFVLGANDVADADYEDDTDTTIYRIPNAVVNEVNIPFDADGITTLSWSGMGGTIEEIASFNASDAIRGGVDATNNFVRSRFTALAISSSVSGSPVDYAVTLTGGNITLSNNIEYLTPEELGKVNRPIAHVTGTRSVTGSFSCYLVEESNGPIDLVEDLLGATTAVTNEFALDFYIGGKNPGNDRPQGPGIQLKIPKAHLEIPSINPDDVISLDVNFSALPSNLGTTDEIDRITYVGV